MPRVSRLKPDLTPLSSCSFSEFRLISCAAPAIQKDFVKRPKFLNLKFLKPSSNKAASWCRLSAALALSLIGPLVSRTCRYNCWVDLELLEVLYKFFNKRASSRVVGCFVCPSVAWVQKLIVNTRDFQWYI